MSVLDSIKEEKTGAPAETGFEYVFNCEETPFDTFDLSGDIDAQLNEIGRVMIVESGEQPFDEFTAVICDAYRLPK
jgi:hypothetical protein